MKDDAWKFHEVRFERGIWIFDDDDPAAMVKPAEVKMIGDKNVRAEVSTIFPSNNLS